MFALHEAPAFDQRADLAFERGDDGDLRHILSHETMQLHDAERRPRAQFSNPAHARLLPMKRTFSCAPCARRRSSPAALSRASVLSPSRPRPPLPAPSSTALSPEATAVP